MYHTTPSTFLTVQTDLLIKLILSYGRIQFKLALQKTAEISSIRLSRFWLKRKRIEPQ